MATLSIGQSTQYHPLHIEGRTDDLSNPDLSQVEQPRVINGDQFDVTRRTALTANALLGTPLAIDSQLLIPRLTLSNERDLHAIKNKKNVIDLVVSSLKTCWEYSSSHIERIVNSASTGGKHIQQSVQQLTEKYSPVVCMVAEKIRKAAWPVFACLVAAFLLTSQSSLFAIGFLVTALNPKLMKGAIDRISTAWCRQHFLIQCLIVTSATIAWPISLAASAFFVGGQLGLLIIKPEELEPSPVQ